MSIKLKDLRTIKWYSYIVNSKWSKSLSPLESCLGLTADLHQDKILPSFMHSLITAQSICSPLSTTCKATVISKQLQKQFWKLQGDLRRKLSFRTILSFNSFLIPSPNSCSFYLLESHPHPGQFLHPKVTTTKIIFFKMISQPSQKKINHQKTKQQQQQIKPQPSIFEDKSRVLH